MSALDLLIWRYLYFLIKILEVRLSSSHFFLPYSADYHFIYRRYKYKYIFQWLFNRHCIMLIIYERDLFLNLSHGWISALQFVVIFSISNDAKKRMIHSFTENAEEFSATSILPSYVWMLLHSGWAAHRQFLWLSVINDN